MRIKNLFLIIIAIYMLLFSTCAGFKPPYPFYIETKGVCSKEKLAAFFINQNPNANEEKIIRLSAYYIDYCTIEGLNYDIAFVQMCLETGFLRFGGLVTEDMNNFCGLGAIDTSKPGEYFESEAVGVLAHIQHLKAYATAKPVCLPLVDPRYKYVSPKGKAPTIYQLAGTWALDPLYGKKLENLLLRLYNGR